MKLWNLVRQWLVVQGLMTWMGGFLFYSSVVVPVGTDQIGAFGQGLITREVTQWMNWIGVLVLALFAWDQWATPKSRYRWICWGVMVAGLIGLFLMHRTLSRHVDTSFAEEFVDYDSFYLWHRIYLADITIVWVANLLWLALTLHAWCGATSTRREPNAPTKDAASTPK